MRMCINFNPIVYPHFCWGSVSFFFDVYFSAFYSIRYLSLSLNGFFPSSSQNGGWYILWMKHRNRDANNKSNEQIQIELFRAKISASGKTHPSTPIVHEQRIKLVTFSWFPLTSLALFIQMVHALTQHRQLKFKNIRSIYQIFTITGPFLSQNTWSNQRLCHCR